MINKDKIDISSFNEGKQEKQLHNVLINLNIPKTKIDEIEKKIYELIDSMKNKPVDKILPFYSSYTFSILKIIVNSYKNETLSKEDAQSLFLRIETIENFFRGYKVKHQNDSTFFQNINKKDFFAYQVSVDTDIKIFQNESIGKTIRNRLFINQIMKYTKNLLRFLVENNTILKQQYPHLKHNRSLPYKACFNIKAADYFNLIFSQSAQLVFNNYRKPNKDLKTAEEKLGTKPTDLIVFRSYLIVKVTQKLVKLVLDRLVESIFVELESKGFINEINNQKYKSLLHQDLLNSLKMNKSRHSVISGDIVRAAHNLVDKFMSISCKKYTDVTTV